ncbi:XdhC family protein [Pedobacter zeae]|uniref:Xanthine dehydrogenase subunit A n=1 Tax=Pedobacter zeae TaxID=1737356 RepID=A0A7W6P3Y8_9SPHI|nr:XdhC/CoxI family protein [Pedobacter zeae]MBB4106417.1 xanthine/CO dehydrogenase XdhC/CoxF family maturation factor [Pedobacter zeae]GGH01558.1 putative xanthine dehydrogenase subunit A [Pedobacter zeae]
MKEITDIIKAYQKATKEGKKTALATVIKVEGSSYRRPGARMLITDDGQLTGAISGGCLEGDALRKALSAIVQQENKLITYDTTDEDDARFGVQLGCNGIVHILFEPIIEADALNPMAILTALQSKRESAVLVTLFSLRDKQQLGTGMLFRNKPVYSKISKSIHDEAVNDIREVSENKTTAFKSYEVNSQQIDAFIEFIHPPISLIIVGAGNDAQPLAEMAYLLGWEVTVVDGRPTHATPQRFANATKILISKPQSVLAQIQIDEQTAFVLMTHNYNYDLELLKYLLDTNAPYIGTLGPKKKLLRMLDELDLATPANETRVHGPIGLDIGAETAEEIAISILAEIKSVFTGASAMFLKEKKKPIHVYEPK